MKTNETLSFKPAVSDADGDALSFQIKNKPSWATFSTVNGQLTGKPAASNVGTFANIVISVSDGKATTSLPPFSISVTKAVVNTVTLTWAAPTQNSDGSTLTDLAGFTVVYGTSQNALDQTVRIDNATASTWSSDNFPSGTYYFAVKAFNTSGGEGSLSDVMSKTFN
jgi:Putative Ig domain